MTAPVTALIGINGTGGEFQMAVSGKQTRMDMLDAIDHGISFCVEKKKNNGEDCEKHALNGEAAFFGVFDGMGGAGAKSCPRFDGKTEAYIASRVTGDAFVRWFENGCETGRWQPETLKSRLVSELEDCRAAVGERSMLVGGIKKEFPTTAAAGICRIGDRRIEIELFWAGDSRVYLLNTQGLAQLTEDDLGGIDAMENLRSDGALTNMVNLTQDFTIHRAHLSMDRPGVIFAASDGCFGYLSTPMEFEYLLLETMMSSNRVRSVPGGPGDSWTDNLISAIGEVAGDDYSLSGYSIGFGPFGEMKKAFSPRARELYGSFIAPLKNADYQRKLELWHQYEGNYHRMLNRA